MPKLTLLMVVTPPDLPITRYTIPALRHLSAYGDIEVIIYLNSLTSDQELNVRNYAKGLKFCRVKSNSDRVKISGNFKVYGSMFKTDSGRHDIRLGPFESCGEIWERELLLLDSELVGLIDADLEIFDGAFIKEITRSFNTNPKLGFMSLNYSYTEKVFETYSNRTCVVWERYHTWFCVYLRKLLNEYSNFCYFEEERDGNLIIYDHSSMLQMVLKKKGYHGDVVAPKWCNTFLHYGAFSQNRSLKGILLKIYRILRIGIHNGWYHRHHQHWLIPIIRTVSEVAYKLLRLNKYTKERWVYKSKSDTQTS